jgi:hypothetical protein
MHDMMLMTIVHASELPERDEGALIIGPRPPAFATVQLAGRSAKCDSDDVNNN